MPFGMQSYRQREAERARQDHASAIKSADRAKEEMNRRIELQIENEKLKAEIERLKKELESKS